MAHYGPPAASTYKLEFFSLLLKSNTVKINTVKLKISFDNYYPYEISHMFNIFVLSHYKVLLRIFQQSAKIPFQTRVIYYNRPIGNLD